MWVSAHTQTNDLEQSTCRFLIRFHFHLNFCRAEKPPKRNFVKENVKKLKELSSAQRTNQQIDPELDRPNERPKAIAKSRSAIYAIATQSGKSLKKRSSSSAFESAFFPHFAHVYLHFNFSGNSVQHSQISQLAKRFMSDGSLAGGIVLL